MLDRVSVILLPSIKAIVPTVAAASQRLHHRALRALLVAMEYDAQEARGFLSLVTRWPCCMICINRWRSTLSSQDDCKQGITSHLADCKIFHFAGHGHTDDSDPSKSQLLLEDGESNPLTVATLLEMNLRQSPPFLAYLSACGTGQIHDKNERFYGREHTPDQRIPVSGISRVIGTLWEVNDSLCVDMARDHVTKR